MDTLLTPEFWSGQIAGAIQNWAVVIPLLFVAGVIGWQWKGSNDDVEIKALRAQQKELEELAEDRRKQALEHTAEEDKKIAIMKAELDALRKLIESREPHTALYTILTAVEQETGALAVINSAIRQILSTEVFNNSPVFGSPTVTENKTKSISSPSEKPPLISEKEISGSGTGRFTRLWKTSFLGWTAVELSGRRDAPSTDGNAAYDRDVRRYSD
jgi:hypothetical protein